MMYREKQDHYGPGQDAVLKEQSLGMNRGYNEKQTDRQTDTYTHTGQVAESQGSSGVRTTTIYALNKSVSEHLASSRLT